MTKTFTGYKFDAWAGWQPVSIRPFKTTRHGKPVKRFRLHVPHGSMGIRSNSFVSELHAQRTFTALTARAATVYTSRAPMAPRGDQS